MTAAALLGAALLLAACQPASTISTLHGVTTESNALGPKFSTLFWGTQWESVSLLGLLPAREPGSLHCYNPRRGPNSAIGMAKDESFYLTRTVGQDVTLEEVLALRDALLQAQDSALDATRARLEALRMALAARNAPGAAEAQTPPQATTAPATPATGQAATPATGQAATPAAGQEPREQAAPLAGQAAQAAREAESRFGEAERNVRAALKTPGLLVVRWSVAQESEYDASAGERASLSGGAGSGRSGLAVIGGVRVSRLYLGSDVHSHWADVRNIGTVTAWPQVTTLLIQARHVAFLSDVSSEDFFRATLEVDAQTVARAAADWKALASLELAAYRARVANLGGMGLLGAGGTQARTPVTWEPSAPSQDPPCPEATADQWHTIYQVTAPLKALRGMWKD
jgi:hypothetical protein